jgi:hypothetical protein
MYNQIYNLIDINITTIEEELKKMNDIDCLSAFNEFNNKYIIMKNKKLDEPIVQLDFDINTLFSVINSTYAIYRERLKDILVYDRYNDFVLTIYDSSIIKDTDKIEGINLCFNINKEHFIIPVMYLIDYIIKIDHVCTYETRYKTTDSDESDNEKNK